MKNNFFIKNFLDINYNINEKKRIIFFPSFFNFEKLFNYLLSEYNNYIFCCHIDIKDFDFMKKLEFLIDNGFKYPYISSLTPSLEKTNPSLFMTKNDYDDNLEKLYIYNDTLYTLQQYIKNDVCCHLHAKFSKSAINYLKKASEKGIKDNKQKEISGQLVINNIIEDKDRFIYIIDVNEKSIEIGHDENVDVTISRYNFHSHPEDAYIRHSVENGWPSLTDYLGYFNLGNNTIFHCIATIEGLYILSFSSYWCNNIKEIDHNFIKKNYEIDRKLNLPPMAYTKRINSILYKGKPIFNLKFLNWEKAFQTFTVNYSTTRESCIATQNGIKNFNFINEM